MNINVWLGIFFNNLQFAEETNEKVINFRCVKSTVHAKLKFHLQCIIMSVEWVHQKQGHIASVFGIEWLHITEFFRCEYLFKMVQRVFRADTIPQFGWQLSQEMSSHYELQ